MTIETNQHPLGPDSLFTSSGLKSQSGEVETNTKIREVTPSQRNSRRGQNLNWMKSRQFNVLLRNETEKGISDIVCHFSFAPESFTFRRDFVFVRHNNVTESFASQEKKQQQQQQMQKNVCTAIKPITNVENKKKTQLYWKYPSAVFCNLEDWK